jgi:D-amino-acid dehydrogenase
MLSREEVRELEPRIGSGVVGGLLHESDGDLGDPLLTSHALSKRLIAGGGTILRDEALALVPTEIGVEVRCRTQTLKADQATVTMGMDSKRLLAPLGVTVPLQAERGYHLILPGAGGLLSRPVTFQQESCVATPMGADLRLAGTVEFAGAGTAADWPRAVRLAAHAAHYFDEELACSKEEKWVGSRPSLPDSLPAIGRLASTAHVGYAFGHQHLGITQAAISSVLLNQLMDDEPTAIDCRPFAIERFANG